MHYYSPIKIFSQKEKKWYHGCFFLFRFNSSETDKIHPEILFQIVCEEVQRQGWLSKEDHIPGLLCGWHKLITTASWSLHVQGAEGRIKFRYFQLDEGCNRYTLCSLFDTFHNIMNVVFRIQHLSHVHFKKYDVSHREKNKNFFFLSSSNTNRK